MKAVVKKRAPDSADEDRKLRHWRGRSARRAFFEFEQALICASEAFYRFAGAALGPTGRQHNLTGEENVILQQLMFTSKPRSVSDLSRFSNRDDIPNIQYSLRKLIAAGLIKGAGQHQSRYPLPANRRGRRAYGRIGGDPARAADHAKHQYRRHREAIERGDNGDVAIDRFVRSRVAGVGRPLTPAAEGIDGRFDPGYFRAQGW